MAAITAGDAYVDTAAGTDDATHGTGTGANACATLIYLMTSRVTTLTGALTVHCAGATEEALTAAAISGHSTAAYKLTIKGDRWTSTTNGLFSTSYYHITQAADDNVLTFTELNLELDGIQFDMNHAGSNNRGFIIASAGAVQALTIKNCWLRESAGTRAYLGISGTVYSDASSSFVVENCIFSGFTQAGDRAINGTDWYITVVNCTFHDCTAPLYGAVDTFTVKNCVFDSCDAEASAAWVAGSDYNSSTLDTTWDPVGSNNHDPCTDFNFADLTNHDFRLTATSGSANIRASGVTVAGTSPDPLGTTRASPCSRGAFEYIVPGGGSSIIPILAAHRRRRAA